jgi:hypothetical protein
MPHFYDTCAGPIEGLYLPCIAGEVLRRENIQTLDQSRANADRLEQFDGIEAWMVLVIRLALAYAALFEEQTGEHEEVWGSLVMGRRHKVSSPTKQGCETLSIAEPHPIRTRADVLPVGSDVNATTVRQHVLRVA